MRGLLLAGALVRTPLYRGFVSQCWQSLFLRNFKEGKVEGQMLRVCELRFGVALLAVESLLVRFEFTHAPKHASLH